MLSLVNKLRSRIYTKLISMKLGGLGVDSKVRKIESSSSLKKCMIGSYCYIGPKSRLYCLNGLEIGNGVIIGPKCTIYTSNHNFYSTNYIPYDNESLIIHDEKNKVSIGSGSWVGDSVLILPGSKIGENCLIGAGSVVRGEIPDGSIVIGNPAVIVKKIPSDILSIKRNLIDNNSFYLSGKY